jgi:quinol monooxygenase YgiN
VKAKPKQSETRALSTTALAKKQSAIARAYQAQMQQMHAALVSEKRGWDSYYEAVDRVVSEKLYVADGYDSAREWLAEHVSDPERTALRYARVARLASPEEIAKYTPTKIDLALSIRDARAAKDAKKKGVELERSSATKGIDLKAQRYEVLREDARVKVDLEEARTPELRAILGTFSSASRKRPPSESAVCVALRAALREGAEWEGVTVSERDSALTISGFRPDQVKALAALLSAAAKSAG